MYVIIGCLFVPLEGKLLLIALVIIGITLNLLVRQMPLNVHYTTVCPSFKNMSNSQALRHHFRNRWK
jgi:hypothetical protein